MIRRNRPKMGDVSIYDIAELTYFVKQNKIQIGIVAIPPSHAQEVVKSACAKRDQSDS